MNLIQCEKHTSCQYDDCPHHKPHEMGSRPSCDKGPCMCQEDYVGCNTIGEVLEKNILKNQASVV